ncbi:MAG: hypothetical protein ABI251_11510 [Mycobacteriaceae bacterium]
MPATVHEYVVDVTPTDGPTFRTKVEQPRLSSDWWTPRIGTQVQFLYDPKSGKVKFDKSDPTVSFKAYKKARDNSFDLSLAQPASTPVVPSPTVSTTPGAPGVVLGGFRTPGLSPEQLDQIVAAAMADAKVIRVNPQQSP